MPKKPKFIGVGSFAEYGPQNNIITEDTVELPLNLYGLSKLTFKKYSEMICEQYDIKWIWLRPCYVYGPKDVSTRLIPTLINKFLTNQPVKLDKCDTIIDYIYIDDFIRFIYKLSMSDNIGVYNVCSGKEYELKSIISKLTVTTDVENIEIGDGSDVDRYVTAVTPSGTINHTIANATNDGINLKLLVTPADVATMTIEFTVYGIILE